MQLPFLCIRIAFGNKSLKLTLSVLDIVNLNVKIILDVLSRFSNANILSLVIENFVSIYSKNHSIRSGDINEANNMFLFIISYKIYNRDIFNFIIKHI